MASTLRDVAVAAGVSITAVSKVLHGRGKSVRVSKHTEDLIRQAAVELNYTPNAVAQSLRLNRTNTVGLIFENFGEISMGPLYYVYLLDGVAQELFSNHLRLTILPEVCESDIVASLSDGRLDGVIWCKMPKDEDTLRKLAGSPVPVVALNAPPPEHETETVFVACDNEGGAALVVEHLAALGHRHILFAKERGEEETPDAVARAKGFLDAAGRLELPVTIRDVVTWSRDADEMDRWLASAPAHTAVFAWNERLAGGILRRATQLGLKLPDQLSVVGFDSTAFCDTTQPKLTSVRQPIQQMARKATRLLLDMIDGHRPDHHDFRFPCTLDVRDSTTGPCCPQDRHSSFSTLRGIS